MERVIAPPDRTIVVGMPGIMVQGPEGRVGPEGKRGPKGDPGPPLTIAGTVATRGDVVGATHQQQGASYIVQGPPMELAVADGTGQWSFVPFEITALPASSAADAGFVLTVAVDGTPHWVKPADVVKPKWLTGPTAPAGTLGADGDLYLDTVLQNVYVRVDGAWHMVESKQSNAAVLHGPADPTPAQGNVGDLYLNETTHTLWVKGPAGWTNEGALTAAGVPTTTAATTLPYDPAKTYQAGDKVTSGGKAYTATGPVAAGVVPPNAPWKLVPEIPLPTATDTGKVLGVDANGAFVWVTPQKYPIVVKATQPTAADYGEATIPVNAIWLKVV